jgi:hypothetical protein
MRYCSTCGKSFLVESGRGRDPHFCSNKCRGDVYRKIPDDEAMLFRLREQDELTFAEIGRRFGASGSSARNHYLRAARRRDYHKYRGWL